MGAPLDAEGIAAVKDAERLRAVFAEAGERVGFVVAEGLALFGRRARAPFWKARAALGSSASARRRRMEIAHRCAPILPMVEDAVFTADAAAKAFLTANAAALVRALDEIGDCEQYEIRIDAPFAAVLERIRSSEDWLELDAARERDFGARLAEEATALGLGLGQTALRMLADASIDVEQLPMERGATVMRAAFLTRRGGGAALAGVLAAIEADWAGALIVAREGPSPATAFGSVAVETADLSEAAAELGVSPTASRAEVDAAYRAAMRRAHPDRAGAESAAKAAALAEATRVMRQGADARRSIAAAGLGAASEEIELARLRREGARAAS